MRCVVVLTRSAEKALRRVPEHVRKKLLAWVEAVEQDGLAPTRKLPGFHDEPLHGKRQGQRSIRLSRAYRAIYVVTDAGEIELVEVQEVHKHDY